MSINMGGGDGYRPVCIDCGGHAGLITDIILHCGGQSYILSLIHI